MADDTKKSGKTQATADEAKEELPKMQRVEAQGNQGRVETSGTSGDPVWVRLSASSPRQPHELLWEMIRDRTQAIGFKNYSNFLEQVLCRDEEPCSTDDGIDYCPPGRRSYNIHGPDSYLLLKAATECFLMQECGRYDQRVVDVWQDFESGVRPSAPATPLNGQQVEAMRERYLTELGNGLEPKILPYYQIIRDRLSDVPLKNGIVLGAKANGNGDGCYGILRSRLSEPCMTELIWSYWHEEGMLVQTMNAIGLRFQNIRNPMLNDPLAHLTIDPLRALNNLLWGHIQDEQHRLTVVRRAYEYEHQYGINLLGKAVPKMSPVDRRSKFVEAFHNLLSAAARFFHEEDDLTKKADGFPLLNALKEVHMLLAEGAHNQYGDLPWTSRAEMMQIMWLLGRPEFREFLGGRIMVPYPEPWMDRVDAMKNLQGWTDTSISVFNSLATNGEELLLSIRFTNWSAIGDADVATAWTNYWRSDIQSYIHSYRTATGVDLAAAERSVDRTVLPAVLLSRRLGEQKSQRAALPPASAAGLAEPARALPDASVR